MFRATETGGSWNAAACWSRAAGARVTGVLPSAQLAPGAAAFERVSAGPEPLQRLQVQRLAVALIYDRPVPVQAECLQGTQNPVRAAGDRAGGVEILDAKQPLAAVVARIEVASDGRQKRAEVQVARRRGGEAAYVWGGGTPPLAGLDGREGLVGGAPITGSGRLGRRTDVRGAPGAPGPRCSG